MYFIINISINLWEEPSLRDCLLLCRASHSFDFLKSLMKTCSSSKTNHVQTNSSVDYHLMFLDIIGYFSD